MEFEIAEDRFGDFVAGWTVQGDEHGFCSGRVHEFLNYGVVVADERLEVSGFRTEAQRNRQFQKEADVEIAEVGLYGIQKQDNLLTPFIKSFLISTILDCTIKDLTHEHGHRVLEHVITYAKKRMTENKVLCSIKVRFGCLDDVCFQNVQRQE